MPGHFWPVEMRQTGMRELAMARRKKHAAEQIVNLLRQVEVGVANGHARRAEIVVQTVATSFIKSFSLHPY